MPWELLVDKMQTVVADHTYYHVLPIRRAYGALQILHARRWVAIAIPSCMEVGEVSRTWKSFSEHLWSFGSPTPNHEAELSPSSLFLGHTKQSTTTLLWKESEKTTRILYLQPDHEHSLLFVNNTETKGQVHTCECHVYDRVQPHLLQWQSSTHWQWPTSHAAIGALVLRQASSTRPSALHWKVTAKYLRTSSPTVSLLCMWHEKSFLWTYWCVHLSPVLNLDNDSTWRWYHQCNIEQVQWMTKSFRNRHGCIL